MVGTPFLGNANVTQVCNTFNTLFELLELILFRLTQLPPEDRKQFMIQYVTTVQ